ncbi:SEL1-like repeat protein [Francisella philomiragia]|uniref:Sel1 repeat family protein n=1 Tax=Francisella philomiragia TaxID=28110 RepID=A0AAW3DCT9_9GAMM|nr:SEL1-like repeat protein [Francisella philomiragia]KFJ43656.1 sel1 repeat family protein [Francisella philomiragia]MBK2255733.1 SEL1-like repeat protein [Francisella philomiragia]MBK2274051.1 SEL1-like repeat protein [Francisella philomiragia]MBK2277898.1 SEL1-like repeat protein [Francisella philomiragia]MBK2279889.1 SEL1-like repeat protein [Francisella philomiragia]
MKKTLSALSLIFVSINAFASLDDCYIAGSSHDYNAVKKECLKYAGKDKDATTILSGTYAYNNDGVNAQKYLQIYIDNFAKNNKDTSILAKNYTSLGNYYYFGEDGAKKDIQKGLQYLTKGAELGNATAQYQLGSFYGMDDNSNVSKSFVLNYYWDTLAYINGEKAKADEFNLIKANYDIFKKQYPRCIAIGDNMVAKAYLDGKGGLPVSTAEAKEYLEKAISLYKQSKEPTANELKYCKPVSDDLNLAGAQKLLASL